MKKVVALLLTLCCLFGCFAAPCAAEGWAPRTPPAVRNPIPADEQQATVDAILAEGTVLFSGTVNKSYRPDDISWLTGADPTDMLVLVWACDDVTHGGWGVLGLSVNGRQKDIKAEADQPDRERLMVFTVAELMTQAQITEPSQFTSFILGAWNGGRIAWLYLLGGEDAQHMQAHLDAVAQADAIIHTYTGGLSNPNASEAARRVYAYLQEINGSACLTGQMESTWMTSAEYEMNIVERHTGRLPAVRGLDFMHNDFDGVAQRAIEWWQQGGIPHICWHTGSDFASGYNESKSHNLDWEEALTPGTAAYDALIKAMDRAVPALQRLEDAGVPVLWRPFHELDGGWFWWSKGGSENFVKLWQLMYSRYTDYWGLDNLIWLLGYSGNGGSMAAWYPGDSYVDVIGADSYARGANGHLYAEVKSIAPEGMPIVFHECGTIPTESEMKRANAPWAMFMVWHTSYIADGKSNTPASLKNIYNSDYFITLDELPAFR